MPDLQSLRALYLRRLLIPPAARLRDLLETKEPRKYAVEFEGPWRDTDTFEIALCATAYSMALRLPMKSSIPAFRFFPSLFQNFSGCDSVLSPYTKSTRAFNSFCGGM
jgi:hypothetical protein